MSRWLDDFVRAQPSGAIANKLEAERLFVFTLWGSAYRAGATAGLSVVGNPDPVRLCDDTLQALHAYALEHGRPQQAAVLENALGAQGWKLAYFAGWNAALDELERHAQVSGGAAPRLLDTTAAEALAGRMLERDKAGLFEQIEVEISTMRVRVPSWAKRASRAVVAASRAAASHARSWLWPGTEPQYDLEQPGAGAEAATARTNVIPISSHRRYTSPRAVRTAASSLGPSRRLTPRLPSSWEPPVEAWPSYETEMRLEASSGGGRGGPSSRGAVLPPAPGPRKKRKKPHAVKPPPKPPKKKRPRGRPRKQPRPTS